MDSIGKYLTISFSVHLITAFLGGFLFSIETFRDESIRVHLIEPEPEKKKNWTEIDFSIQEKSSDSPVKEAKLAWKNSKAHSKEKGKRGKGKSKKNRDLLTIDDRKSSYSGISKTGRRDKANKKAVFSENNIRKSREIKASIEKQKKVDTPRYSNLSPQNIENGEDEDDKPLSLNTREFKYMAYFSIIDKKINSVWSSPVEAIMDGDNGNVTVQMFINRDGSLEKSSIYTSSGFETLDTASLDAVVKASPFQPIPHEIGKERLNVLATFRYNLGFVAQ